MQPFTTYFEATSWFYQNAARTEDGRAPLSVLIDFSPVYRGVEGFTPARGVFHVLCNDFLTKCY